VGERDDQDQVEYSVEQVARLIGLREGWGSEGRRHVTVVDLLSWARDPGGTALWFALASEGDPAHAWMARRGPLPPHSGAAAVLWDFLRAVKTLSLREQAVVALSAFGFRTREIGQLLGINRSTVSRILWGEGRGAESVEGAVAKITRAMNEPRDRSPAIAASSNGTDERGRTVLKLVLSDPRARRWIGEIREELELARPT
jgi:hypothetical protein